jgi:putative ABC transport system permease protein
MVVMQSLQIIKQIPGIDKVSYYSSFRESPVTQENKTISCKLILCEEEFFDIFSVKFLAGNPANIFENRSNVVLSKSFAEKFFGDKDPLEQTIKINHNKDFIVAGIFEDIPGNLSIKCDGFCHTESRVYRQNFQMDEIEIIFSRMFLLLNPNTDINSLLKNLSDKLISVRREPKASFSYKLFPFKGSYFNSPFKYDHLSHANINLILLIAGVTFIVLFLSVLNYINLTLATNISRLKEFGIKKTTGAGKREIFQQIIVESFLGIVISVTLAFVFIEALNPLFEPLLGRTVGYYILFTKPGFTAVLILFIIAITFISAVYPAYKASKTKPVTLMKYSVSSREGSILKNILNTVQFVFSSFLIISLIAVYYQTDYLKTRDLGFDKDELLKIDVHYKIGKRAQVVKNKLLLFLGIKSVTITDGVPCQTNTWMAWDNLEANGFSADEDFLKTFNIPLLEGRFVRNNEESACVMNESALRESGKKDWQNETIMGNKIVGIIKDFNHQNLYKKSGPLLVFPIGEGGTNIIVKLDPKNIHTTIDYIKSVWEEVVPDFQLNYSFYDEWLDSLYKKEERNAEVIKIFAVIAIVISLLGLYGITELATKKRIKEISVRKIFGAGLSEVVLLLNKGFLKWVLSAYVIACPISYLAINKWLENYPYRIELSWQVFAFSCIIIFTLSLLTTSYRVLKSALANPVEALRYE